MWKTEADGIVFLNLYLKQGLSLNPEFKNCGQWSQPACCGDLVSASYARNTGSNSCFYMVLRIQIPVLTCTANALSTKLSSQFLFGFNIVQATFCLFVCLFRDRGGLPQHASGGQRTVYGSQSAPPPCRLQESNSGHQAWQPPLIRLIDLFLFYDMRPLNAMQTVLQLITFLP